jgi:YVTN family beta-propeller protein
MAAARAPGEAPAGTLPTRISERGTTVLPSGRLLTPLGRSFRVAPHPFGLALSPNGKTLASASSGTGPFCVTLIDRFASPRLRQIPENAAGEKDVPSVFMGLAFSRDSRALFVAGGDNGAVHLIDVSSGKPLAAISCNDAANPESYTGDLALSPDGRTLYVADQAHFRVAVVDVSARKVVGSVRVGRYPFALALSPDGRRLWVANVGSYEYRPIEGGTLPYPAFGVPSREAVVGVTVDGKRVPGLGSPNAPEALSVWALDVTRPAAPKVVKRIKTGTLVGALSEGGFAAVGGAGPNALVATASRVYVSNGGNDTVQAIDARTGRVVATIPLGPVPGSRVKGAAPFGLALSPDGRRLYVAEAGINAVGVISTRANKVIGHIPVGWYPSRVRVSPDGKTLYVANAKGFGAGPNGGVSFRPGPEGAYIGSLMKGTVSIAPAPSDAALAGLTAKVLANNGFPGTPPPANLAALRKAIRYVVYITKENRTFDEVYGDVPGARGDPSLARYGAHADVAAAGQPSLTDVNVMPNHRAMALRYGIADNFHADGDVSADGHRWLVGIYPNEWTETQVAAAYGGKTRFSMNAPGRRAFFGSDASSTPEDYPEAGSLFDHLARNRIPFRNYGEGFEFAGVSEDAGAEPTGARESLNFPMTKPLWENTSRDFPIFNMNIPDQYRADQFLKDVDRWRNGAQMPRFVNIALPNDHSAGLDAASGYPYTASYMADNDLALGRIVEALSHTPYWPRMVIFITEDDAQGGVDHVDAHRTILIVAGPHVKPGYVSHRHGSLPSVVHTVNRLFGLPDLNQFDATASDLTDFLRESADAQPYTAIRPDPRVFDPSKAMARYGRNSVRRDDPAFLQEQQQQAIERR